MASLIPRDGRGKLGLPEVLARLWRRGVSAAFMAMPEAAVDEADCVVLGKDEVGPAGQALPVKSVPEAAGMEGLTQNQLRFRVFAPDGGHNSGSCCLVDGVCHGFSRFSVATVSRWAEPTPMLALSLKLRAGTSGVSGDPLRAFSGIDVRSS